MKKVVFLFLCFLFLWLFWTSFSQENSARLDDKIQEASHRIISLMKKKTLVYQEKIKEQLESWKWTTTDTYKIYILENIQYLISWFMVCESNNAERKDAYFECEYLDKTSCETLWRNYTACASACRHTNSSLCLLPCVEVCAPK